MHQQLLHQFVAVLLVIVLYLLISPAIFQISSLAVAAFHIQTKKVRMVDFLKKKNRAHAKKYK